MILRYIDPGVYDYVIKCVGGVPISHDESGEVMSSLEPPLYETKYFHINTFRKYEIIGSSQEEADGCTVCIENANLEPRHWEIRLKEAYNYYIMALVEPIQDVSKSNQSNTDYRWTHSRWQLDIR